MSYNKTAIIFAPHPDDETFGCGGIIAKKISEGHEVYIVVMTDGRYAFLEVLGIEENPTPSQLKDVRMEEVKRAAKILGVPDDNLIFLNFIDGTLEDNMKEAEESVINILYEKRPNEIYLPYRWDCHPDHRAAYKIVKNAVRRLNISAVCYQYSITHIFPRFGRFIDALLRFIFRIKKVSVDISNFLHIKNLAIMEFKSELTFISAMQHRPVITCAKKFQRNKETFYVEKIL